LKVAPTPAIAFLVKSEGFDCGVMISASHNPYYDNGIKVFDKNGSKLSASIEMKSSVISMAK
jgi:phosphoglucosamine mutase